MLLTVLYPVIRISQCYIHIILHIWPVSTLNSHTFTRVFNGLNLASSLAYAYISIFLYNWPQKKAGMSTYPPSFAHKWLAESERNGCGPEYRIPATVALERFAL